MQLSRFFFLVAFAALPVCLLSTTWLYFYPLFHACDFPAPQPSPNHNVPPLAPFRLLALGDPQLEGDSSLPKPNESAFPSLRDVAYDLQYAWTWKRRWAILSTAATKAVTKDVPRYLEGYRKRIDLWGNDLYLAHIVRQLRWWTKPTHVAVLGDLLGSQWVSDEEFAKRADRYWNKVFRGMERVPNRLMEDSEEEGRRWGGTVEMLGEDKRWENRVINIAGNHDIGYAGDLDEKRIERFEKAFGKVNWDIVFKMAPAQLQERNGNEDVYVAMEGEEAGLRFSTMDPKPAAPVQSNAPSEPPALRLVILNTMNLDTPALSESLQHETYDFMTHVISTARSTTDKTHTTVLLTHIPLNKKPGLCVDSPFFDFFPTGSGIKEQNMLSEHGSKVILESIFGMSGNPAVEGAGYGRNGIIINGHDHAGCDTVHYISQHEVPCPPPPHPFNMGQDEYYTYLRSFVNTTENPEWHALRVPEKPMQIQKCLEYPTPTPPPHIREITLRSMMGDFSGYAGFVSAWFDEEFGEFGEWKIEFETCGVGVQHWWWAVHITDFITLMVLAAGLVARGVERVLEGKKEEATKIRTKDTKKIGKVEKEAEKQKSGVGKGPETYGRKKG